MRKYFLQRPDIVSAIYLRSWPVVDAIYFFILVSSADVDEVCRGWMDHDERLYNVLNVDGNGLEFSFRVAHVFVVVVVACVAYSNEATLLVVYIDLGLQVQRPARS